MTCPACGSELEAESCAQVTVDACPNCGGVWLDQGELGRVIRRGVETIRQAEALATPQVAPNAGLRRCPKCPATLQRYRYAGGVIELESCPKCGGVWADEGELLAIANRSHTQQSTDSAKASAARAVKISPGLPGRAGLVGGLLSLLSGPSEPFAEPWRE